MQLVSHREIKLIIFIAVRHVGSVQVDIFKVIRMWLPRFLVFKANKFCISRRKKMEENETN